MAEVSLADGAARFALFVAILFGSMACTLAMMARRVCLSKWAREKRASWVPFVVGVFLPLYGFLFGWSLFTTTLTRISPGHVALAVLAALIALGAAGLTGAIIDWARLGNRFQAVPVWSLSKRIYQISAWTIFSLLFALILDSNHWRRW